MTARTQQSFFRPQGAAIVEGSSTPNPGAVNAIALSTTTFTLMRWTGTCWTSLNPGVPTRIAADQTYTVAADRQSLAFVPIVVDGTLVVTGTLVML